MHGLRQLLANSLYSLRGAINNFSPAADTKHPKAWQDYGYPEDLSFDQLYLMQERFGLARAGVNKPVTECWRTAPTVYAGDGKDVDNREPTDFEIAFEKFAKKKKLWKSCKTGDHHQRIGQYGGLIVQVRGAPDQVAWEKPLGNVRESQIVRFIPFYEGQMRVAEVDSEPTSERYGMPVSYNFKESFVGNSDEQHNRSFAIHHSRVIIFSENAEEGSIYSDPCNKAGYNSLLTLEKIIGAGGEGFWKNAAQKIIFTDKGDEDSVEPNEEEQEKIDSAIKQFAENMEKQLFLGNMDAKTLDAALADPMEFFEIALNDYSASIDIPAKILIGAQTGRLAADEDGNAYLRGMMSRRETVCTEFVSNVIEWLFDHGVFARTEYTVWWDDLLAPAQADKFALGNKLADINHKMTLHGMVFTPNELREVCGYARMDDLPEPPDADDETAQEGLGGEGGQGLATTEPKEAKRREYD